MWRRPVDGVLMLVAVVIIAGCSATPPPQPGMTAPTASRPTPPPATASTQPVNDDPARLLGMDRAALAALLGNPVRVRRDLNAEIRQYRSDSSCQVDAFLYPDGNVRRVSHVEFRDGVERLSPAAARTCLRRLIEARATS